MKCYQKTVLRTLSTGVSTCLFYLVRLNNVTHYLRDSPICRGNSTRRAPTITSLGDSTTKASTLKREVAFVNDENVRCTKDHNVHALDRNGALPWLSDFSGEWRYLSS